MLLDVGTADKRTRIAAVVGAGSASAVAPASPQLRSTISIRTRARKGASPRIRGRLHGAALARRPRCGLAIAQKNSTEILDRRAEMGTDFAVAEECSRYSECADYVGAYGERVLMIEYRDSDFAAGCAAYGATHAIVRRDLNLVTPANRPTSTPAADRPTATPCAPAPPPRRPRARHSGTACRGRPARLRPGCAAPRHPGYSRRRAPLGCVG